jgi:hypothetical protein
MKEWSTDMIAASTLTSLGDGPNGAWFAPLVVVFVLVHVWVVRVLGSTGW